MTELCWALGTIDWKGKDLLKAINTVRSKGLSARVSVVWPTLDILFIEGVVMGYKGDLSSFSVSHHVDVNVFSFSDAEALVELEDKDYIHVNSIESLISLIKEITVKEALVIGGRVFPILHLIDPSSINVDVTTWRSFTEDVDEPKLFFYNEFVNNEAVVYNIVSLTDNWTLDILYCRGSVMGATLYMPEQVETVTGADAFLYPLSSPGKWLITKARPFLCPEIKVRLDPELEEKIKKSEEGVVKL
ncbi:MAG: hypothetical protein GXO07_04370 [Crenarchaeota archaeon]|nr:hypothetical protein [Thermoproteota archaeon]